MNCRTAQNLISAYVDGELCGVEMLRLRDHLAQCKDCHAEVEELKAVKRLLSGQNPIDVPSGFEERLAAFVLRDEQPARREVPTWRLALLSSVAAAVVVFSFLQVFGHQQRGETQMTASTDDAPVAFDVNRDQLYASGLDQFGGQGPVLPASNVSGR